MIPTIMFRDSVFGRYIEEEFYYVAFVIFLFGGIRDGNNCVFNQKNCLSFPKVNDVAWNSIRLDFVFLL